MSAPKHRFVSAVYLIATFASLVIKAASPIVFDPIGSTIPPGGPTILTGKTLASLTNLAVYFGEQKIAEMPPFSSENFIAIFTNNIPGDFQMTIKGMDQNGAVVSSDPVLLHYPSRAAARFIFPTNGATVFFGEEIKIQVEPDLDRGQVDAISIYYPDMLGMYSFEESPPYELVWRAPTPGTYTFIASPFFWHYGYGESTERITLSILPESLAYVTSQPHGDRMTPGPGRWYPLFVTSASRGPQQFQWLKNGVPIPGATNYFYDVESEKAEHPAWYSMLIDNFAGRTSSSVALMDIDAGGGGTVLLSNLGLEKDAPIIGSMAYLQVSLAAGPAIDQMRHYRGYAVVTNGYFDGGVITLSNVPPGGKAFVQVLALRNWESDVGGSKIIEIIAGGERPARLTGLESFKVSDWHYYSLEAKIDPSTANPIYEGSDTLLKATAYRFTPPIDEGNTNIWFQWKKNGVPIAGATNDVLRLQNVGLEDAGWYSVIVTDRIELREPGVVVSVLHSMKLAATEKGELTFRSNPGARYTIETSEDLNRWSFWKSLAADGKQSTVSLPHPASDHEFYRVIAEP